MTTPAKPKIKATNTAKRPRRMVRDPNPTVAKSAPAVDVVKTEAPATPTSQSQRKSTLALELLQRPDGATLDQLVEATGWLPHSTRAALTGLKKKGYILASEKPTDGPRIYRVTGKVAESA
ncbi:DUF3489 domain-containing protein [Caenibius sp. WL]|uniref:DUF3489 domain-containing protein n=1 Tax=Caenibius sp. WL TaxID=2872646 RepID=UPI001C997CAA|nr:DUF3489 domain-containing protein [Caenibius sp. WL]